MKTEKHLQQKHMNYKKVAVSVVAAVFLVLLYMLIFSFSEQDGETSGSISGMIAERCAELLRFLVGKDWSAQRMLAVAEALEHPIRKLAHFAEYACMGILVYSIWSQWMNVKKHLYVLTVLWVIFSGAADEFHQLFVPGRYGCIADVLLDTAGGVFGLVLCVSLTSGVKYLKK